MMPRGPQTRMGWEWNGLQFRTLKELCDTLTLSPATVRRHVRGVTTKPNSLNLRVHAIKRIKNE